MRNHYFQYRVANDMCSLLIEDVNNHTAATIHHRENLLFTDKLKIKFQSKGVSFCES